MTKLKCKTHWMLNEKQGIFGRDKLVLNYKENSLNYWNDIHQRFFENEVKSDDWLDRFDDIIMQTKRPILDLGCGSGNNTLYLVDKGKQVIPCDQSQIAIDGIHKNFPQIKDTRCFNMLDGFPFEDESFDVIIADLCLHYFAGADTENILSEIRRILVPGGHLLFRVNTINDVNHGAGQGLEVEHHVFVTEAGTIKRFFDEDDILSIFKAFEIMYVSEELMGRYKLEKRVFAGCVQKVK